MKTCVNLKTIDLVSVLARVPGCLNTDGACAETDGQIQRFHIRVYKAPLGFIRKKNEFLGDSNPRDSVGDPKSATQALV